MQKELERQMFGYSEKDYKSRQYASSLEEGSHLDCGPQRPDQLEQINKVIFMNLKEFEQNQSALAESSFHPFARDRSSGSYSTDSYLHQRHPSFLDDDSITSFESNSSKKKDVAEYVSSPGVDHESPPKLPPLIQLYLSRPRIPNSSLFFVVKLSNIADDTTILDLEEFFTAIPIIRSHTAPHFTECIHIIHHGIEKTNSVAFVEFPTEDLMKQALLLCQSHPVLKKRLLHASFSTQSELLRSLFPKFKVVESAKPEIENGKIYVSRNEIMNLLQQCRSIRQKPLISKRSVAERAIEMVISILSKVPWHKPEELSTLQRDHLFELAKLSVEALMGEPKSKVTLTHLSKLVRATLCVPLFTEKQKLMLLNSSHLSCPHELVMYVYTSDETLCIHSPNVPCGCCVEKEGFSKADNAIEETSVIENMQQRALRADRLISSLRAEQHEVYRKYQDCLYALNDLEEKFDSLLGDHLRLQRQTVHRVETLQQLQTPPQSSSFSRHYFHEPDFDSDPFEN